MRLAAPETFVPRSKTINLLRGSMAIQWLHEMWTSFSAKQKCRTTRLLSPKGLFQTDKNSKQTPSEQVWRLLKPEKPTNPNAD